MLSDKVPYFIIDLLQQVPFVYVHGLGRFEAIFHPALVDLPQSQIKPPYIEPDFSLNGESSDEILAAFMHYVSGIGKPAAEEAIQAFVEKIKVNTEDGKTYPIEKFGTFSTSSAGNLRFTPDWDAFNLSFSGLEVLDLTPQIHANKPVSDFIPSPPPKSIVSEITAVPVQSTPEIKVETVAPKEENITIDPERAARAQEEIDEHTSRLWWMILTSALILIAVLCAYLAWDIISNRNKLNDLKQVYPDSTAGTSLDDRPYTPDTASINDENIPVEEPVVKEEPVAPAIVQEEIVNPCFVVVGAFSDAGNVVKMVSRLESMGYVPEQIKGGSLTRVAIKTSCDHDNLQKVLNEARSSINPEGLDILMQEVEIRIAPEDYEDQKLLGGDLAKAAKFAPSRMKEYRILRRSLDARFRPPVYLVRALVTEGDPLPAIPKELENLPDVSGAQPVHIIGAGPAGYFAAIECIKEGLRPIIIERGKDVQTRRKDLRAIQQEGVVNPHSNYCFGEGGAGTYSDGKLYTRSGKRGNIDRVLRILVECGANPEILVDAHPHIGSNKLPGIIATMRIAIEAHGGQVMFNSFVTGFSFQGTAPRRITGIEINGTDKIEAHHVILATGHSARDIFQLLLDNRILIEPKPFALGVRIEHSQNFVDLCQYGIAPRGPHLPAASYALNAQVENRGVFSFCMCPGGLIVPAATSPGEIVINGMSLSRRDSPYANSGVVTAVELEDMVPYKDAGVLMGVALQREVEQKMYSVGDGSQAAPAQRLTDFLAKKTSLDVPPSSYIPGLFSAPVHELLPSWIYNRLAYGIRGFDHKMNGYIDADAVVVATESRTSSPVRVPRDSTSGMHVEVKGLFPCGEGAGYAGGILSAAMDGQFIARAVKQYIQSA